MNCSLSKLSWQNRDELNPDCWSSHALMRILHWHKLRILTL